MRMISVVQPWCTLLAAGAKLVETRPINWSHRGPIGIHASGRIEPAWRRIVDGEYLIPDAKYYIDGLRKLGIKHHDDLPRGCVIATANLMHSYQFDASSAPEYPERAFGDFSPGRYGLVFENMRMLAKPILAKGALGLWEWDAPADLELLPDGSLPPAYLHRDPMREPQMGLF